MIDFNSYGVKAIEIKFICKKCKNIVTSEEIRVPSPDFSSDNHSDSIRDNEGYAICGNCGEEYNVTVYAGISGGDVDVDGIENDAIIEIMEHDEFHDDIEPELKATLDNLPKINDSLIHNGFELEYLYIKDWFLLKNFEIKFNQKINVLIGENGSGKSSVIECLALIFGHLHSYFIDEEKKSAPVSGYIVHFKSQNSENGIWHDVVINNNTEPLHSSFNPLITIDNEIINITKNADIVRKILPLRIGLYYAGITDRLKKISRNFEEKYIAKIRQDKLTNLSPLKLPTPAPFLYIKDEHLPIMLLSLLMSGTDENKNIIEDSLFIDINSTNVEFVFKRPEWHKGNATEIWGAEGVARLFIIHLIGYGDEEEISKDLIKIKHELSYVRDEFNRIFTTRIEENTFEIFDYLLFNDLLDYIKITWKNPNNEVIDLNRLSEGEKQFIINKSLSLLWKNQKGFLLLDEPDTFLHPKWQQNFINILLNKNTQTIVSTHSPNIVSALNKDELKIINQGIVVENYFNPYGKNVDNVLMDHFGLSSTRNIQIQKLIESIKSDLNDNIKVCSAELDEKITELEKTIDKTDSEILLIKLEKARRIKQLKDEKNQ